MKGNLGGEYGPMLKKENAYRVSVVNPNGRNHLEDSGLNERILFLLFFKKRYGLWTGLIWLTLRSSSIKCRKTLDELKN
jgi:hypothetical protein